MSKILVYKYIDIFNSTDYSTLHKKVDRNWDGSCPNFGNKLWYQGIISEISTQGNIIDFYDGKMSINEINEYYDCILYPMANIFSIEFAPALESITSFVRKIKIPIYIISCGAQANSYDDLDDLCKNIGTVSKTFISAVYNTGGQFALRGYFTAEFFKKLGFYDAAVVGCPSLFQCGRDLKVDTNKVEITRFKPSFNGNLKYITKFLRKYDNSIFYDQDCFFNLINNPNYFDTNKGYFYNDLKLLRYMKSGIILADLIEKNRLRLIADMWDWKNDMINEGVNFSFGSRIHGSVMPLLCGIPAVVLGFDSRTREMAEFYDIPCLTPEHIVYTKEIDLYKLYENLDYSIFNKRYAEKFDNFSNFLINCGLVDHVNSDNIYMNRKSNFKMQYFNTESIKYAKDIVKKRSFFLICEKALELRDCISNNLNLV